MQHLASLALAASLLLPVTPAAAAPRSVDPTTLDIAGVKTGMDYDQAVAAVVAHFSATPADIKPDPHPSQNIVTGTKLPSYFTYAQDGATLTVHFEGRVPRDPAHPLAVSLITYELPWTPQNAAEMIKAATARYGTPSNAPNTLPMQWCLKPSSNTGIGCPLDTAKLELSQVRMQLLDPAWQQARISFTNAARSTKPNF